ncbi:hypothetical protein RBH94_08380 [Aestuariibaculum sp. YM273]|uniref:hypothetical protein n=1 Tax=Aestuariibaculum sp. YM273 TaxID=3070659 RepID=UPI0027DCC239|nr:hypothetical protein [Aestuariibaculum sp. YM273]WMI64086.1 hypothetical protein RBH94_08380 [Aestuariibaculum sp. YM273]
MNANDVYNIAQALPKEELVKLCDMLGVSIKPKKPLKPKKRPLPDFTVEDGIRYLLANHFNKIRTP